MKLTNQERKLVKEYANNLVTKKNLNEVHTDEFELSEQFESLHDEMVNCLIAMDDIAGGPNNKQYRAVEDLVSQLEKIEKNFNFQIKLFRKKYSEGSASNRY